MNYGDMDIWKYGYELFHIYIYSIYYLVDIDGIV